MEGASLRDRNRAANVAEVQSVALGLMSGAGFDAVTVEEVAAAAGVSPSTVYRYFGTKDALVLSGDGIDELASRLRADDDRSGTAVDLFGRVATAMIAEADEAELLARLRLVFDDPALTVAFQDEVVGQRAAVTAAFAAHRGAASASLRDEATAAAALGVLIAVLDRWQRNGGAKSLTKMLAKGLGTLS